MKDTPQVDLNSTIKATGFNTSFESGGGTAPKYQFIIAKYLQSLNIVKFS